MKPIRMNQLQRCTIVTSGILSIGFGCAAAIYLTAPELTDNPLDEFEQSKMFAHEVQRMGGRMALVANDLSAWLSGLWRGQHLAYTVAVITVVIALVYYVIASGRKTD
jgi:ADP-dependent phosphofructokinase/glucokinase